MDGNPSERFALLRESAFKTVQAKHPDMVRHNPRQFIKEVSAEFIQQQVNSFPEFCDVARVQNFMKWKELRENGHQGKYSGTYGWSKDGNFKFEYEIPQDLYLFMQNLVYKEFWDDSNGKIWRKFMKKVCDGEDPERLLIWVKSQYGPNSQEGIVN